MHEQGQVVLSIFQQWIWGISTEKKFHHGFTWKKLWNVQGFLRNIIKCFVKFKVQNKKDKTSRNAENSKVR